MLKQSCLTVLLGFSICWTGAVPASAQQSDGPEIFYEYARNKIGLLRYCRDQGLLGQVTADRAVKAIETGLERLSVTDRAVKERGERAEKAGERGFWEANGKHDVASVASLRGTTLTDLCKELGGQTPTIYQAPAPTQVVVQKVKAPDVIKVKAPETAFIIDLPAPSAKPVDSSKPADSVKPAVLPSTPAKAPEPAASVFPICN